MRNVTVIGAGSWGTALAMVLAANGHLVRIHTANEEVSKEINSSHTNKTYLPEVKLPSTIQSYTSYKKALEEADMVIFVIPSHGYKKVIEDIKLYLKPNMILVSATKGIESETLCTMTEIMKMVLPKPYHSKIAVLSGPSHAEEVSKEIPTTIVSASHNKKCALFVQEAFSNESFRVYTNTDVKGVEIAGALKNIIALGAGISDGLGLGDNSKAALLTRGLYEITRLGMKLGAKLETFAGLTGVGDLIVTGTSKHSRNWRTGHLLANGYSLSAALKEIGMISEGVKSAKSAYKLAKKVGVDTPIINEIYKVLYEGKDPREATQELMNRKYKDEH
ncbi:NAD(P)H-dependent glycerol-3-phosphate dehydrogenase [Priestia aryabhattai]